MRPRGFTLVEVLVAMMIMAILAVMAWQGVDGIVRARDASQSRLEQTLRLNTVLAQWEQDLALVQESPAVPGLTFDGATVRMTRRAERGLQVVTWTLQPAADGVAGGGTWLRWAGPPVVSSNAFYYWTIMHVTVSFFPLIVTSWKSDSDQCALPA